MKTASSSSPLMSATTRYASTSYSSPSPSYTNHRSMLVMAKGSRKSKSSSQGSGSNPRRITSNVKENLQSLKLWKEHRERRSGTPKPATSYRRKKLPKEVLPVDEVDDGDEEPEEALFYTKKCIETGTPVLLVDGYNVCGYWPKLKKHFVAGRLDVAREKLINELITFSSVRAVKVVVVFDAMKSGRPTHKETSANIDIVYTGNTCADLWIDKEVVALLADGCPQVWVATSDRLTQESSNGAGAFVWSCRRLISEINDCKEELAEFDADQRDHSFQGKLLMHNIHPIAVEVLKNMRNKLAEQERSLRQGSKHKK